VGILSLGYSSLRKRYARLIAAALLCAYHWLGLSASVGADSSDKPWINKECVYEHAAGGAARTLLKKARRKACPNSTPASPIRPSPINSPSGGNSRRIGEAQPPRQEQDKNVKEDLEFSSRRSTCSSRGGLRLAARGALPQRQRDRFPGTARSARRSGAGTGGRRHSCGCQICGYRSRISRSPSC